MQSCFLRVPTCIKASTFSFNKAPCYLQQFQRSFMTGRVSFSQLRATRKQLLSQKKLVSACMSQAVRKSVTAAATSEISPRAQKIVGGWLMTCAGMCAGAVILGGITRLTESGLSMVDWQPIKDMKPPRSQQEWEEEFERYKQYPEYKHVSSEREMTLSDFKFIFYMEWGHRLWGRGVGLVFLLPAAYFLKKGWISKALKPRLALYTALIGFQGFLGWYMVKSGLQEKADPNEVPRVSQYRLAAHLGSALVLYSLFFWQGLTHLQKPIKMDFQQIGRVRGMAHGLKTLIFVTALSGAFVAGLDAGLTYNSYPKMADRWIPTDLFTSDPKWKNIFENPTTVQFIHRHLAESTILLVGAFWVMCRRYPLNTRARLALNCLLGMAIMQGVLGVSTLLSYVHTHVAATHQSGAIALLSMAMWFAHEMRRLPK